MQAELKPRRTFFHEFKTDNNVPVTVEYSYDHDCVCILECWREPEELGDVAIDINLSDAEEERMCAWIMEHRHWTDHADDSGDVDR
jgi:hypothetical protein